MCLGLLTGSYVFHTVGTDVVLVTDTHGHAQLRVEVTLSAPVTVQATYVPAHVAVGPGVTIARRIPAHRSTHAPQTGQPALVLSTVRWLVITSVTYVFLPFCDRSGRRD